MQVILKRRLVDDAGGAVYEPGPRGASIEMPDRFRGRLPRDAKIVEEVVAPTPVKELTEAELRSIHDPLRVSGEKENEARQRAIDFQLELEAEQKKKKGK